MTNSKLLFKRKLDSGKLCFFAGSGISFESGLIKSREALEITLSGVLNKSSSHLFDKNLIISRILPECFYENLINLTRSETSVLIWKSLSPITCKKYEVEYSPNINHLSIVKYSFNNKIPIFTTNFDCLFEFAANQLGIKYVVFTPKMFKEETKSLVIGQKPDYLVIIKLHGSILMNELEDLENIYSTISLISKINFEILDLLNYYCEQYHITFVGYSGRDADYFPEIRKFKTMKQPFWVDEFVDYATIDNANKIQAMQIFAIPSNLFRGIYTGLTNLPHHHNDFNKHAMFNGILEEISEGIKLSEIESLILISLLYKDIGLYEISFQKLNAIYRNKNELYSLSKYKQLLVIINLAKLAHETSRFESCLTISKIGIKLSKSYNMLPNKIILWCLESEALRMFVPFDNYLLNKIYAYRLSIAIFSFIKNLYHISRYKYIFTYHNLQSSDYLYAAQESIEHRIRLTAIYQSILLRFNPKYTIITLCKNILGKRWLNLKLESQAVGYSMGFANSDKFHSRISPEILFNKEGELIFHLLRNRTGIGLHYRNLADYYFLEFKYSKAKRTYEKFYNSGKKSGNVLNAIKGLIGIIRCNLIVCHKPLLTNTQFKDYIKFRNRIESKYWKIYLHLIQDKYFKNT